MLKYKKIKTYLENTFENTEEWWTSAAECGWFDGLSSSLSPASVSIHDNGYDSLFNICNQIC